MRKLTAFIWRNTTTKVLEANADCADAAYTKPLTRVGQKTSYGPSAPDYSYENDRPAVMRPMPFEAREEQWC